jgi:MHS family shikimate/dehydroshikimate transporter-like MFS transporter
MTTDGIGSQNDLPVPVVNLTDRRTDDKENVGIRLILSSYIGTTIEFFDFFIYSLAAATVVNRLFFPKDDPAIGTLAAFGILAIGYLARPIGGIIYGHFGDRIGRKKVLVTSVVLMGASTVAVGLLPTYDQIGIWAPILLLCVRMIQGLAVAGEYGGALTMLVENAGIGRRGLWGCVVGVGAASGHMLGTAAFALMSYMPPNDFIRWGWRIPFLVSALLVVVGLWIRLGISESPVFLDLKRRERSKPIKTKVPIVDLFATQYRQISQTFLVMLGVFSVSLLIGPFAISYSIDSGFSRNMVLTASTVAWTVDAVVMIFSAWLSDRIGRKPVFIIGAVLMAIATPALLLIANGGSPGLLALGFVLSGIAHGFFFGPTGAYLAEMFHTGSRYTGVSVGYQLASTFGGGFTPFIAKSLLLAAGGAPHLSYVLVFAIGCCAVGLLATVWSKETYRLDLRSE